MLSDHLQPLLGTHLRRSDDAPRAFSPLSLFAAGEQGWWYDPYDLSTQFQDTAGTIPVTAVGQAVALLLDKSKGLVRGPEISIPANWSGAPAGTTKDVAAGSLAFSGTQAAYTSLTISPTPPAVGETYEVNFTVSGSTQGGVQVRTGGVPAYVTGNGNFRIIMTALSGSSPPIIQENGSMGSRFIGTVSNVSIKLLPGNHLVQATTASRWKLEQDSNGFLHWLLDGVDDGMATAGNVDFTGTDKVTVFSGVHKASDAATGIIYELTSDASANRGFSIVSATPAGTGNYRSRSTGGVSTFADTATSFNAPRSDILTLQADIAADVLNLRSNGSQVASSAGDQGTGNYANALLNVGRRNSTSFPFNGRLYTQIGVGAAKDAATISRVERYIGQRMGVVL